MDIEPQFIPAQQVDRNELAWASERRRELIRKIRAGLSGLSENREFWATVRRHLENYDGPDKTDSVDLAHEVDEQLGSMATAINFGLDWLGSAMNSAVSDDLAQESVPAQYREWILNFAVQEGTALRKVKDWLRRRLDEQKNEVNHG